jgi:hypothetical protein
MGKRHNHKIWRINKEKTKIERNKRKTGKDRTLIGNPQHGVIRLLAMERRMRPSRSSVFIVLLCCCWYCPLEANGANIGENLVEFSWNLIGAISRIRHGHDDAVDRDDQSDPSLLDDPRFLYATLYRFVIRIPTRNKFTLRVFDFFLCVNWEANKSHPIEFLLKKKKYTKLFLWRDVGMTKKIRRRVMKKVNARRSLIR